MKMKNKIIMTTT